MIPFCKDKKQNGINKQKLTRREEEGKGEQLTGEACLLSHVFTVNIHEIRIVRLMAQDTNWSRPTPACIALQENVTQSEINAIIVSILLFPYQNPKNIIFVCLLAPKQNRALLISSPKNYLHV